MCKSGERVKKINKSVKKNECDKSHYANEYYSKNVNIKMMQMDMIIVQMLSSMNLANIKCSVRVFISEYLYWINETEDQ